MTTILFIITVLAVAAACASVLALRRVQQAERLRSEARVAALAAMAADDTPGQEVRSWRSASETPAAPAWVRGISLQGRDEEPAAHRPAQAEEQHLFGAVQREPSGSPRLAFVGGLALIVAISGGLLALRSSSQAGAGPVRVAAAPSQAIELLSLSHARSAAALTISGLVRNPAGGAKLEGLTAVVSLLDGRGSLISTKDVPLDYRALAPGEEAPFTVTVPDSGSVAKYRVSFRAGSDVVPHVDRRSETKFASAS